MTFLRQASRLVVYVSLFALLLALPHASASSSVSAQQLSEREGVDSNRPHHYHGNPQDGLKEQTLKSWLHKIGLRPNKDQVNALYRKIQKKVYHKHHHKDHHHHPGKKHDGKKNGPRKGHEKGQAGSVRGTIGKGHKARPVHADVLPPVGKPKGLRSGHVPSTPPTRNSSPIAAANAPLPEPANTLPAATASKNDGGPWMAAPVPLGFVHRNGSDVLPPLTTPPSSSPSSMDDSGTTGSIASSTPTAINKNLVDGGDSRLDPLLTSSNSSGRSIAGIPIANDDGDIRTPLPQTMNGTKLGGAKSGAERRNLDVDNRTAVAVVAGVLVTALCLTV